MILKIENLTKNFGEICILKDISFEVKSGSVCALLGPNGSGKTTLLKSIMGLVGEFGSGDVYFNGRSVKDGEDYRRSIVYMPQIPGFLPNMTVRENIDFFEKIRQEKSLYKEKLIHDLGIEKFLHKRFNQLSGGMKQKVNLLLCFMFDFKMALLDEPGSGLDPHVMFLLKEMVRDFKKEGKTFLFTSHIMSEVEEIADTMVLLVDGNLFSSSTTKEFIAKQNKNNLEEALLEFWSRSLS